MRLVGNTAPDTIARFRHGAAIMGHMPLGAGEVFSSGTTAWAYCLDDDPLLARVTRNVLDRFAATP